MKQYGQVFLAPSRRFFITCTQCERTLIDYNEFQNHVLEIHLDPLSIDKRENVKKIESIQNHSREEIENLLSDPVIAETIFKKETNVGESSWVNDDLKTEIEISFKQEDSSDNDGDALEDENLSNVEISVTELNKGDLNPANNANNFPCPMCNKYFNSENLKKHEARKRCGYCPVCTMTFADLYRHIKAHHKEYYENKKKLKEPIVERNCVEERSSDSKQQTDDLNNDNKNNGKVMCLYCGELFTAEYFQTHQAQRKCGKCPVCFSIVTDLFRHVPKYHKEYVEEKRRLKEKAVNRLPLSEDERWLKRSKEENQNQEQQPNLSLEIVINKEVDNINQLENDQTDPKNTLLCMYCEKTFKCKGNYNKHIKQHESKSDTCKFCGKRFKYLSRLKKHLRLHTGERPYKCEICAVSFNESSNLKAHFINRHTEGLNLKCTYENCDKIFKTNARRRYHECYAHSNKYKNLCKECGLIFRTSGSLNEHTKKKHIKYEDRQFSCKYCEKKFAFKFELTPHEMMHLGQKRYHCELCTKGFIARKSFKRHCRTVHGKEPEIITKNE